MFLLDACSEYRSTEPVWFRFFRGFFAAVLTAALVIYLIDRLDKLGDNSVINTFALINGFQLNATMYTGISNVMESNLTVVDAIYDKKPVKNYNITNSSPNYQKFHLESDSSDFQKESYTYWFNVNITTDPASINDDTQQNDVSADYFRYFFNETLTIPNDLLFLNFESFRLNYETSYYDDKNFNSYNTNYLKDETIRFSINLGKAYLISFDRPTIDKTSYSKLELNPRLEMLPINLEPNVIQFGFFFRSSVLIFEDTKKYSFGDVIADIGGFYGAIVAIYIMLFGMEKHEPWGVVQKFFLSYIPCRKSFTRKFARKYVSPAGLPLVEKVNKRSNKSEEYSLDERVQILETLLQDYYLDDFLLKAVKNAKIEHKRYVRMRQQSNEMTEQVPWV